MADIVSIITREVAKQLGVSDAATLLRLERAAVAALQAEHSGDTLRYYVPKLGAVARSERVHRVRGMLAAGEPAGAVARAVGLSERQVYRIRDAGTWRTF